MATKDFGNGVETVRVLAHEVVLVDGIETGISFSRLDGRWIRPGVIGGYKTLAAAIASLAGEIEMIREERKQEEAAASVEEIEEIEEIEEYLEEKWECAWLADGYVFDGSTDETAAEHAAAAGVTSLASGNYHIAHIDGVSTDIAFLEETVNGNPWYWSCRRSDSGWEIDPAADRPFPSLEMALAYVDAETIRRDWLAAAGQTEIDFEAVETPAVGEERTSIALDNPAHEIAVETAPAVETSGKGKRRTKSIRRLGYEIDAVTGKAGIQMITIAGRLTNIEAVRGDAGWVRNDRPGETWKSLALVFDSVAADDIIAEVRRLGIPMTEEALGVEKGIRKANAAPAIAPEVAAAVAALEAARIALEETLARAGTPAGIAPAERPASYLH